VNLGVVGCGNIAERYAADVARADGLEIVALTDAQPGRAQEFSERFGGTAHGTLDALLADDRVETVVNLTFPQTHAAVTRAALEAGKHVHSEKPLALAYDEARDLVELAEARGVKLSAAPATLLGEAQQTAWKLLRDGEIGRVRVAYAEANWGRIESWHPAPQSLYEVGPMVDVGVYPLAILTALFGPARRVSAFAETVEADRVDKFGEPFRIGAPDFVVAVVELATGVVVRLTASFLVGPGYQRGIEFHGEAGILHLRDWSSFDGTINVAKTGNADDYASVPLLRKPYAGIDWSRALVDLAGAVGDGREPRASGGHAAHIVEILDAIGVSSRDGGAVEVHSTFDMPEPLDWAR
jgi:predicted dehydrogenase